MNRVDPEGKFDNLASAFYGTNNSAVVIQQQKSEEQKNDAAKPSAVSISFGVTTGAGVTVGKSHTLTLVLRGSDSGRIFLFEDTKIGVGTPELSASLGLSISQSTL